MSIPEPTITLDERTYVEVRAAMEVAIKVLRVAQNNYTATHYEEILTKIDADWDVEIDRCRAATQS